MLAGLGHDSFIRGDDQQRDVDSACSGEHCANEGFVSRNVHDPYRSDSFDDERRKAKVDRYASTLLFGQAISVHTGERLYQRGLAVVDVPGGSENHAALQPPCSQTRNARSSRSLPRCS